MVEFAERMGGIKASDIRQLLAVASKPEIISFAGGLPAPELFPVDDIKAAYDAVLDEAGVAGEELLVACGTNYADALSASAAGRPIFLVGASLTDEQMEYLTTNRYEWGGKVYVIGGKGAVSEEVEADVARCVGATRRLFGSDRYLTSKVVAMEFFRGNLDNMVIASGKGFPDGLSGGPVACAYDAPLLLVADGHFDHATELFQERGADRLIVMGGKSVISRDVAEAIAAPVTETD